MKKKLVYIIVLVSTLSGICFGSHSTLDFVAKVYAGKFGGSTILDWPLAVDQAIYKLKDFNNDVSLDNLKFVTNVYAGKFGGRTILDWPLAVDQAIYKLKDFNNNVSLDILKFVTNVYAGKFGGSTILDWPLAVDQAIYKLKDFNNKISYEQFYYYFSSKLNSMDAFLAVDATIYNL